MLTYELASKRRVAAQHRLQEVQRLAVVSRAKQDAGISILQQKANQ